MKTITALSVTRTLFFCLLSYFSLTSSLVASHTAVKRRVVDEINISTTEAILFDNFQFVEEKTSSPEPIAQEAIASMAVAYGQKYDAQTKQRAEIHAERALYQAEIEMLKQNKTELQQKLCQRETQYRELCQHREVPESEVEKFHYVYGPLTVRDWGIYCAPDPSTYFVQMTPLFGRLEFLTLPNFRAWIKSEYPGPYTRFLAILDPNSERVARAEEYARGSFSLSELIICQQRQIKTEEEAHKEHKEYCLDGAFYPHWGSAIGSPDFEIEPHRIQGHLSEQLQQELRELDDTFQRLPEHHFNSKQYKIYINLNDISWKEKLPWGPKQLFAYNFKLWRFPAFRRSLRTLKGYKEFIRELNYRAQEILEAEKYMPEGFCLREYLRQEKIRFLTPEEYAQWQAKYPPQKTDAKPVSAALQSQELRIHDAQSAQDAHLHNKLPYLLEHEQTYLRTKQTYYQHILERNQALSEAQRVRLTELVHLIDNPDVGRAVIRDLLQTHQRKAVKALAHWKQKIAPQDHGKLLKAAEALSDVAQKFNDNGLITESLNTADACWLLLDSAESTQGLIFTQVVDTAFTHMLELYQSIPRPLRATMGDIVAQGALIAECFCPDSGNAVERGVWRGVVRGTHQFAYNTLEAIRHPAETLQNTIATLGHLCACLDHYLLQDQLLQTLRNDPLAAAAAQLPALFEQLHLTCYAPLNSGTRATRTPPPVEHMFDQALHQRAQWGTLWELCCEKQQALQAWQASTTLEDRVETVTALLTEQFLGIGSSYLLGAGIQQAGNNAAQAIRSTANSLQQVAIAADGTLIVQGIIEAETVADALANAGIVVGRAAQAAGPAQLLSQHGTEQQPRGDSRPPVLEEEYNGKTRTWPDNRAPKDHETILKYDKAFKKTNYRNQGAIVYRKGKYYYCRDQFHHGEAAHLEVFNKRGKHIGEASPLTGEIDFTQVDLDKELSL